MGKEILSVIEQLSREKGIDPGYIIHAIEEAVQIAAHRLMKERNDLVARLDRDEGVIKLYVTKKVVQEVHTPEYEISLEEAQQLNPDVQIGDEIQVLYSGKILERLRTIQIAKQVIFTKVKEAELEKIYRMYKDEIGQIVTGTVKAIWDDEVILELPDAEALLPKEFQLKRDEFERGQYVRAVIVHVHPDEEPPIVVSRVHPDFIYRLMEMEIEEVFNGIVELVRIVREPGERSKVAVRSRNPNVDPVGACVGVKGSRILAVMNELRGERIDVIQWSEDVCEFAANALKPAKVYEVHVLDEEERVLEAIVADDQLSIAIGRGGQNVKLASRLVGWRIEVIRASEKDGTFFPTGAVEKLYAIIKEKMENGEDIVQKLIESGYDRLYPLIRSSVQEIAETTGFEIQLVRELKNVIRDFTRGRFQTSDEQE